ncbi:MAG: hypothetical protein E7253_03880 [Lachnospiraceae bacterium]|nr:hypothetical protein [Lachnospiraceae bacterium]
MKILKKLIMTVFIFGIFFLTGCGIEVKTNMTINNKFEGTKVISCFVSKQDMKLHFKDESSKIEAMLENHCPGCFDYTINETKTGTEYVFTLSFTSLDNYKAALTTVLNFSPDVRFQGIDSVFSKSIDLSENFTSIDLLRWFEILLTEEYSITEAQLEKMWDIKETTLTWLDQTYHSPSSSIQVSDHSVSSFDGISIFTEEKDDRGFIRRIQFAIPKETLDKRVIELEQIFENIKPEGTTGIWTTTDTGKIYEMTFTAEHFTALSEKTGEILGKKTQNISDSRSIVPEYLLRMNVEYSETLDFSGFACTPAGEVPVAYYFKPNSMTTLDSERIQKEINNAFIPKEYDNGYYRIFNGNCSTLKITTLGTMHLPVLKCDIHTTLKTDTVFKREFAFTLDPILDSEEYELLSSFLNSKDIDHVSMKLDKDNKHLLLTIYQSGSVEDINLSSELLFGIERISISRVKPSFFDIISKSTPTEIIEQFDLTDFLGPVSENYTLTYTFSNQSKSQLVNGYIKKSNDETIAVTDIEDNSFIYENNDTLFTSHIISSSPSLIGISLFFVLVLLILIGLFFFIKKNPMKRTLSEEDSVN